MQTGRVAQPVVLVDGRNAMRSRWPNLAEDWFVERTREWAKRDGAQAVIVFDGRGPGGLVGEQELDERTTVVGTGGEIADDWIAARAPQLHAAGRRVWLVSSDRGLRERVAGSVERVLGGGAFAGLLGRLGEGPTGPA
jgi:predicted RNA-binding protein with PIN domain